MAFPLTRPAGASPSCSALRAGSLSPSEGLRGGEGWGEGANKIRENFRADFRKKDLESNFVVIESTVHT
jgi:hypothetical protein